MKTQVDNSCRHEFGRAKWVNIFAQTEEVRSVRVMNRYKDNFFERDFFRTRLKRRRDNKT